MPPVIGVHDVARFGEPWILCHLRASGAPPEIRREKVQVKSGFFQGQDEIWQTRILSLGLGFLQEGGENAGGKLPLR